MSWLTYPRTLSRDAGVSPAAYLRRLEMNLDPVDDLRPAPDLAGPQVDALGNLQDLLVDDRVVAPLGEDVDEHRNGERLVQDGVFRVHMRPARQRMPCDDRHELVGDERDDVPEQLWLFELIAVE